MVALNDCQLVWVKSVSGYCVVKGGFCQIQSHIIFNYVDIITRY